MLSTIATEIKELSFSEDGEQARFVLVTKHSGEIAVALPTSCLQKLQITASAPAPPVAASDGRAGGQQLNGSKPDESVHVSVPNKWLLAADGQRGLVVAVFNHRMPHQYGFALSTKAAREFAAAMIKQVEVITANKKALSP